MSYKDKPQIKLYKYENSSFVLQAIIDDFQEVSFERNLYQAGTFTISINYNIPNALKFQRGIFVQFGNDPYDFGEIITIRDSIGQDGKGSQIRTITGYDARYILKRRVIKNMNSNGLWVMTAKGELCLRNLIKDQCGSGAESKRQLPIINTIPASGDAIGKEYSVSEQFTNLYEVCKTIATQSEIGWRLAFDGTSLNLECYQGTDRSQTVQFSTSFDSLADGQFTDSSEIFSNAIYVGGKGQNDDRDIYEGENGTPSGLDRFESWDNQSSMTTESEYEAEALSMLTQYGQTIQMSGNGLAKCPYIYKEQYDVGDLITVAFSGKSAVVQILSVTEHWAWGSYDIQFSFGKPQNNLSEQLQLMLRKIQSASEKSQATDSVRWYTLPTDSSMPKADVTYNTIGFTGSVGSGMTFTLYLDDEKTGSKTYHVYFKQLGGTGKLTLTTGKAGATNLVMEIGTYVAIIYVDENGNITSQGMTATSTVSSGNSQPVTSGGVFNAIDKINYSSSARNIDTLYPGENGKSEVFGGNFSGNVPEPMGTAILKTFRVSAINSSEVQIYQEWEAYGTSASGGYSPNKYFRFGYFTGSASPTWTSWQKVIRNSDAIQYLGWSTYSGSSLGEAVLSAMNSLPALYSNQTEVYCFRGTWAGQGYFQAYVSTPRTVQNFTFNVLVQYERATSTVNVNSGIYILDVLYNGDNTPKFSLLRTQKVIAENSDEPLFVNITSNAISITINGNTGTSGAFSFTVPHGYKVIGFNGYITSGPAGAINLYSLDFSNFMNRTGTFTGYVYFRNYTDSAKTASIQIFLLCAKIT